MYTKECNNPFTKNNSHKAIHFSDPSVRGSSNNTLIRQVLSDNNLDKALDWLRHSASKQDHCDVWHLSCKRQRWDLHKENIKQRILDNTFEFQVVHDIESFNQLGQRQVREIRCAEDRILIRALSQVLTPIAQTATPKECTHLANRGGLKGAVKDIQQHLNLHPDAFIYKSDVKNYYASIEHRILHDQLCQLLPHEPILCRLLWQFMQRTVERGGNYRDISKGIPLGSSLSPLLAALYLIPLDKAFSQNPVFFYRRYMDDWVIICSSRRKLRQTTKKVYSIMKSLNVEIHPDKTWLGRVKNGFDFLGFRITPTTIQASTTSVSRRDDKIARLYEQGASKKRIGQYLRHWLGWTILVATTPVLGVGPNTPTSFAVVTTGSGNQIDFTHEPAYAFLTLPYGNITKSATHCAIGSGTICVAAGCPAPLPAGDAATLTTIPLGDATIASLTFGAGGASLPDTTSQYCLIKDGHNALWAIDRLSAGPYTTANAADRIQICAPTDIFNPMTGCRDANPTAVPIFTPLGIMATIGGLLWFGRRRKAIKLTQN